MERLPAGRVPDVRQPLASDDSLKPFFPDEKVIKAAGDLSGLDYWLLRYGGSCCQWPHSDYHYHELTTLRHELDRFSCVDIVITICVTTTANNFQSWRDVMLLTGLLTASWWR